MAFLLARPASPQQRENHRSPNLDEQSLRPQFNAAPHTFSSQNTSATADNPSEYEMARDKEKARLEILLSSDTVYLKGTGVDIEPTLLTGYVALYLTESTSIKAITLQFRGKAKLPLSSDHDKMSFSNTGSYVACNHDWSFLEGERKHSHTLKEGRHFFPFQLNLGGTLPANITTTRGASITYKLRAHAVRTGLSHNLQASIPVTILRTFAPESLEYQQTLEIENTWPDKLMYSIMIPHKAWAAGDSITAQVKLSPLSKGTRVVSITTSLNESTKIRFRDGRHDSTRVAATVQDSIIDGQPIRISNNPHIRAKSTSHSRSHSGLDTPTSSQTPNSSVHLSSTYESSTSQQPGPSNSGDEPENTEEPTQDIVTLLTLPIPPTTVPTHSLEPILISHRVQWCIFIANSDGHVSELRCSLPVHILDNRLLDEARSNTAATRRLLIGGPEVPPEEQQEMDLPSYAAHVRDRVANMFLPEAITMRVTNPWVHNNISPVIVGHAQHPGVSSEPPSRSGHASPLEAHILSHLPHVPGSNASTPLDWVNSELLLSLSSDAPPTLRRDGAADPSRERRPGSTRASRRSSRSRSPDFERVSPASLLPGGPNETFVHNASHASRNLHSLLSASLKPFTSHGWLSMSAGGAHSSSYVAPGARQVEVRSPAAAALQDEVTGSSLLHRAFTEVPDYGVAARGFLGGVPPLDSMRGLPAYAETETQTSLNSSTA